MADKKNDIATISPAGGALASVLGGLAPAKYADDSAFKEMASGGGWLPRLQLFGGNSDLAKEGKIQMGHYGVITGKDTLTSVGAEVDCLVLSWRPKAMDLSGDEIITNYNPQSEKFKRIMANSELPDSSCMFGPEFLLYLPSLKKYVTFMMGSKSSRREAPNLKALMGKPATLKVTLIVGKKYKWHNPIVTQCSAPFALPTDMAELKKTVEDFNNPTENTVEEVKPTEASTRDR